jgi:RHS repeat-associated protein
MNRLVRLEDWRTGTYVFEYDDWGRRKTLRYPNGVVTSYLYTDAGRTSSIVTRGPTGTVLQAWCYGYDQGGNPLWKQAMSESCALDGQLEFYGYDRVARLIRADYPDDTGGGHDGFGYDGAGNRIDRWKEGPFGELHYEITPDDANRLVTSLRTGGGLPNETTTYTFDEQGNQLSETVGSASVTYTWDAQNRLLNLVNTQGTHSYEYGPDGIRTRLTEPGGNDLRFLHDAEDIVAEYAAGTGGVTGALSTWYTHGPGIDEPLAAWMPAQSPGESPTVRYLHADHLGSVTVSTDGSGTVVGLSRHRAFGEVMEEDGVAARYRYTGRELDGSALQYSRARYIDNTTGNFLSRDPLTAGAPASSGSGYAYALQSPVALGDASGLIPAPVATLYKYSAGLAVALFVLGTIAYLGFDVRPDIIGHFWTGVHETLALLLVGYVATAALTRSITLSTVVASVMILIVALTAIAVGAIIEYAGATYGGGHADTCDLYAQTLGSVLAAGMMLLLLETTSVAGRVAAKSVLGPALLLAVLGLGGYAWHDLPSAARPWPPWPRPGGICH